MSEIEINQEVVRAQIHILARLVDWSESSRFEFTSLMTSQKHAAWSQARILLPYRSQRWSLMSQSNDIQKALVTQMTAMRDQLMRDIRELTNLDDSVSADLFALSNRINLASQQADMYSTPDPVVEPVSWKTPPPCPAPGTPADLKERGFTMPSTTPYFSPDGTSNYVNGASNSDREDGKS